jgi:hypothetical protein
MIVGGAAAALITYMACAIDIERDPGVGPSGLHLGDGDHCFTQYAQTAGVPDCHFTIADACLDSLSDGVSGATGRAETSELS